MLCFFEKLKRALNLSFKQKFRWKKRLFTLTKFSQQNWDLEGGFACVFPYGKNQATPPKDVANKEVVQIQDLELRSAVFDKVKHTVPA